MNSINTLIGSKHTLRKLNTYLAAIATFGMLALAAGSLSGRLMARPGPRPEGPDELNGVHEKAQVAELHELEEAFHHAGSYGGNLDEMMSLRAEGSSFTAGGTTYTGKDASGPSSLPLGLLTTTGSV